MRSATPISEVTDPATSATHISEVTDPGYKYSAANPRPQNGKHLLRVHWLRQVIPSTRLDTLLSIAFHSLGRDSDDWQFLQVRNLTNGPGRIQAVELRHHNIHQHRIDIRRVLQDLDRV